MVSSAADGFLLDPVNFKIEIVSFDKVYVPDWGQSLL